MKHTIMLVMASLLIVNTPVVQAISGAEKKALFGATAALGVAGSVLYAKYIANAPKEEKASKIKQLGHFLGNSVAAAIGFCTTTLATKDMAYHYSELKQGVASGRQVETINLRSFSFQPALESSIPLATYTYLGTFPLFTALTTYRFLKSARDSYRALTQPTYTAIE